MVDKGLPSMKKSVVQKIEPYGTPECTGVKAEQQYVVVLLVCTMSQIR